MKLQLPSSNFQLPTTIELVGYLFTCDLQAADECRFLFGHHRGAAALAAGTDLIEDFGGQNFNSLIAADLFGELIAVEEKAPTERSLHGFRRLMSCARPADGPDSLLQ